MIFIFPDMKTAIVGDFVNGFMVRGRETKVVAERCMEKMKEIKIAKPKKNGDNFINIPLTELV